MQSFLNYTFECHYCSKDFSSFRNLKKHWENCRATCKYCNESFRKTSYGYANYNMICERIRHEKLNCTKNPDSEINKKSSPVNSLRTSDDKSDPHAHFLDDNDFENDLEINGDLSDEDDDKIYIDIEDELDDCSGAVLHATDEEAEKDADGAHSQFKCHFCDTVFADKGDLNIHEKLARLPNSVLGRCEKKCGICGELVKKCDFDEHRISCRKKAEREKVQEVDDILYIN